MDLLTNSRISTSTSTARMVSPDNICPMCVAPLKLDVRNNLKTSQELRMLSSVTLNCQVTMIVANSGSQLSES